MKKKRYKVDRLLTGLTAQQKGTAARWYSNKTSLGKIKNLCFSVFKSISQLFWVKKKKESIFW